MKYVAVEGINGCGKTTLVKELQTYYDATTMANGIATAKFPVNHMQDVEIEAYHRSLDPTRMTTEHKIAYVDMETRYHKERMAIFGAYQQSGSNKPLVTDRSFISSWVYSRAMGMESPEIDKLHEVEKKAHQLAGVIFIDIDAKIAFRRVERRGNLVFNVDMFKQLRSLYVDYFNWLHGVPVMRIPDGRITEDTITIARTCLRFVSNLL